MQHEFEPSLVKQAASVALQVQRRQKGLVALAHPQHTSMSLSKRLGHIRTRNKPRSLPFSLAEWQGPLRPWPAPLASWPGLEAQASLVRWQLGPW